MIKPICDSCKQELDSFGAILFSPPMIGDLPATVGKYHICLNCYLKVYKFLELNPVKAIQPEYELIPTDELERPSGILWRLKK